MSEFSQNVEAVSRKFRNIQELVNAMNLKGNHHPNIHGAQYCCAVFACAEKRLKQIYRHERKGKRKYQVCGFDGTCNQQTNTPMFYDYPKKVTRTLRV